MAQLGAITFKMHRKSILKALLMAGKFVRQLTNLMKAGWRHVKLIVRTACNEYSRVYMWRKYPGIQWERIHIWWRLRGFHSS